MGVAGGAFAVVLVLLAALYGFMGAAELRASSDAASWSTVFSDGFEFGLADWAVEDASAGSGEFFWATTTVTQSEGTTSVWATGGGSDGELLQPLVHLYPPSAFSTMTSAAIDVTGANHVRLLFDYWTETEENFDLLEISVSNNNGVTFSSVGTYSGDSGGWQSADLLLDSYITSAQILIRFTFSSNGQNAGLGVFVDNVRVETLEERNIFLPIVYYSLPPTPTPTPTATPTATPAPWYYHEDFNDGAGGWPQVDNTHVSNDCFKWYLQNNEYWVDICDDRTDVKVSPGVNLPNGDYEIEVDARFRPGGNGWWTSYGILFDAKDDPDPSKPNLGDYYMLWVLWEGEDGHRFKILKDVPGDQIDLTEWIGLNSSVYNYGTDGTAWNNWRIERTESRIRIFVNDHQLLDIAEARPRTNFQVLFGVFASTYETNQMHGAFDNYFVYDESGTASRPALAPAGQPPIVVTNTVDLDKLLPHDGH